MSPSAAWDAGIARSFGAGIGRVAFRAHLERCRSWAQEIVAEAASEGVLEAQIGPSVGRPDSSVAKLIDEYLYQVLTRERRF